MIKKTLIATYFTACVVTAIRPLSETAKNIIAFSGGTAIGVGAGLTTKTICENHGLNGPFKPLASTIVGVSSGALSWYLLDMILYNFTPPGRVLNAAHAIAKAKNDCFVGSEVTDQKAIIEAAHASFNTNWPLVLARSHILQLSEELDYASEQLDIAYDEALSQKTYYDLCKRCKKLQANIPTLKGRISYLVGVIAQNASYREQAVLYEKHMEAERQRDHERNMQLSQQIHDSIEKSKEREFKEKMVNKVNQPGRPTIINVNV